MFNQTQTLKLNIRQKTNPKTNLQNQRKKTIFTLASLMFILVLLSSIVYTTFTDVSPFVSAADPIMVKDEVELREAVNTADGPVVIILTTDIQLTTSPLNILGGKSITLMSSESEGFCRLIGAANQVTITISGELTLENVIVTHGSGVIGGGVAINNGGRLIMNAGAIWGNNRGSSSTYGGGVYVYAGGSFTMYGDAVVANNTATNGGGIYNTGGTVTMETGVIANNTATNGGGIYNTGSSALFTMENGAIANNTANHGGGIYNARTVTMETGAIANNTASGGGGGGIFNTGGTVRVFTDRAI